MSTTYNCVHYDRDLMRSCIYGLAVGDALGVPYEFCERGTFECTGMVGDGTHTGNMPVRGPTTRRWPCVFARASNSSRISM